MARIPRRLAGIGASDLENNTEFDSYIGPSREITVDHVRGIIALHNGVAPGGLQFKHGEVAELATQISDRINGVDDRIDTIDGRVNAIDGRIDGIDLQVNNVDDRVENVERRYFNSLSAFLAEEIPVSINRVSTGVGKEASNWKSIATPGVPRPDQVQTADNRWWERIDKVLIPEMFGAVGNGSFTTNEHTAGTDNTTAIANTIAAAIALGRPIELSGVYRTAAASLVLNSPVEIYGLGPATGFVSVGGSTDNGIWDRAGCHLHDMRVLLCTTASKPANQGHLQSVILVTDKGYYVGAANEDLGVVGFKHYRLRLTRRAVSGGGGSAWYAIGHNHHGYLADFDDNGSASKHSNFLAWHWSGKGDGYTLPLTKTWHPHDIIVSGNMHAENSNIFGGFSSFYNITTSGKWTMVGGDRFLYILPGDETDTLADPASHPAGIIGKGNNLLADMVWINPTGAEKAIEIFSQGTSPGPWRFMPDNPTVGFMSDLEWDIRLGNMTVIGATAAAQGLMSASYIRGNLTVGHLKAVNSNPIINGVECFHSQNANIIIGKISGTFRSNPIQIVECSGVKVLDSDVTITNTAAYGDQGLYCFGALYTGAVSGAHSLNANKLTLSAPLGTRMGRNTEIRIGTSTVWTTAYCPPGVTVIPITPLPAALTGGETITFDHSCRRCDVTLNCVGGFNGADISNSDLVLRGSIQRAKQAGIRVRNSSRVDLRMQFSASGYGATAAAFDVVVLNSSNLVTAFGCIFGHNAQPQLSHCIVASTAEGTWRRFTAIGCSFVGYNTAPVSSSSINNYLAVGCTDKTGAVFSNP